MTPYLRTDGPISGRTPRTETPGQAKPGRFAGTYEADPDWRERAACADYDPETWFPLNDAEYGVALLQAEDAKTVCRMCPVADACLRWALDTGQSHGVWGGMTAPDRARLKRSLGRKSRATESAA